MRSGHPWGLPESTPVGEQILMDFSQDCEPRDEVFQRESSLRESGFPGGSTVKNLAANQEMQETQVLSLGGEDPLEQGMANHFSIVAWRIPWTEEPGGLQSIKSHRAGHD